MDTGFLSGVAEVVAPQRDRWFDDPVGWIEACVQFQDGRHLNPYQREILSLVAEKKRVAVRGPHTLGKTCTAALLLLWFAITRDGRDWKAITTASAWRQMTDFFWPEVHKWTRHLDWGTVGRRKFRPDQELRVKQLYLSTGHAFPVVSDQHEKIEGAHADHLLFIFDESKAIPPPTWDALEGALGGTGEVFVLAISTPGEPQGRFYDIHSRKKGYEDWHVRHITLEEAIKAGQVKRSWAEQRAKQWGPDSAVYTQRVLGEFASSDEDGLIPLGWVEAAQDRWLEFHAKCGTASKWRHHCDPGTFTSVGVDPARSGPDKTCFALRHENQVYEIRRFSKEGTTETAGRTKGILEANGGRAVVDVIGIGAGVVDQLREDDRYKNQTLAFNSSESTNARDASGELGFANVRSAAYWHLRELLDPDSETPIMLPPDDDLTGDLTAPHYKITSAGKILVESKDELRKASRLGRSTDVGDAVIQAFWTDVLVPRLVVASPLGIETSSYWRQAG